MRVLLALAFLMLISMCSALSDPTLVASATEVNEGTSFTVSCTTGSDVVNANRYQYSKDGTAFYSGYRSSKDVSSPTTADSGVYTCKARDENNNWTGLSAGVTVTVKTLTYATVSVTDTAPAIGDTLTITCTEDSNVLGVDRYKFMLDGTAIYSGYKSFKKYNSVTTSESGTWTCYARDENGDWTQESSGVDVAVCNDDATLNDGVCECNLGFYGDGTTTCDDISDCLQSDSTTADTYYLYTAVKSNDMSNIDLSGSGTMTAIADSFPARNHQLSGSTCTFTNGASTCSDSDTIFVICDSATTCSNKMVTTTLLCAQRVSNLVNIGWCGESGIFYSSLCKDDAVPVCACYRPDGGVFDLDPTSVSWSALVSMYSFSDTIYDLMEENSSTDVFTLKSDSVDIESNVGGKVVQVEAQEESYEFIHGLIFGVICTMLLVSIKTCLNGKNETPNEFSDQLIFGESSEI